MEKNKLLKNFFDRSFENEINQKMMYYSYKFEYSKVFEYIFDLLYVPLNEYIEFIIKNYDVYYLEASDIMQFSDFEDCTINICKKIISQGDKGYSHLQIGKILENDSIKRNEGAYTKYGENHAKTACQFGLLHCIDKKYFVTCIGYVISELSSEKQLKLLNRLLLRNKLIRRFIYKCHINDVVIYNNEVSFLKESTKLRRKSNVKKIVEMIKNNNEYDLATLLSKIEF